MKANKIILAIIWILKLTEEKPEEFYNLLVNDVILLTTPCPSFV